MGSVSLHLVKVLFLSSLGLGPFGIEVGINLGEGFHQNAHLLLPRGKYLIPLLEFLLLRYGLLLQLYGHHHH
jgi:hypothetical protein